MIRARTSRSSGQFDHVVGFDAKRILDDLRGAVAVVALDREKGRHAAAF